MAGPDYLVAHACFRCRKSFKNRPRRDARCPQCGGSLYIMGRSFHAPKQRDKEQWEKVRRLHQAGFRFFSYRSETGPALPSRLADVEAFIAENPSHPLRTAKTR
jgi:DNA-directed RNA polymerase subunit RPC12/RpoP